MKQSSIFILLSSTAVAFMLGRVTKKDSDLSSPTTTLILSEIEFPNTHNTVRGDILLMQMKEDQQAQVTIAPHSRHGSPAQVQEGSVEWKSSDETIATVEQNPTNQLQATVKSVSPGEALITVKADADLGDGVREITGAGSVIVVAGDAAAFDLSFGTAQDVLAPATEQASEATQTESSQVSG